MANAGTEQRGHCLCGATRYTFSGPANWVGHCHCESCRRQTGSAYTTYIGVPCEAAHFTGTPPAVFASSPGVERLFCGHCGTPIAYRSDQFADEIHFFAATLKDPDSVTPAFHVYWDERLSWTSCDDELPKHAGSSYE
ncbi:GFA family protein [Nisaea denitrificans]|uniref:GFA family protein n=1 Tax=Nisaea denitrificans TaxID=390877 RepID=UPI00056BFC6C|nr:GFA family protein [Nisaea denitrificans]